MRNSDNSLPALSQDDRLEVVASQAFQDKRRENGDIFSDILQQTKREVRGSIIEFLTNKRWGTNKKRVNKEIKTGRYRTVKLKDNKTREEQIIQTLPTTETSEDWISNVPNAKGLMELEFAIEIGDYVADQVGELFSTTYYDPNTNTTNIAALIAMASSHMLDNPRYEFRGNETDSAAFALKVVSHIDAALKRSIGGFMTKTVGESTTNIVRRDIREGNDFAKVKGRDALETMFGIDNKR